MARRSALFALCVAMLVLAPVSGTPPLASAVTPAPAQASLPTPEQFFGFRMGTDNKLARWDRMVEYFTLIDDASPRVQLRELGRTTLDHPFVLLEIASEETLRQLDRFKTLQRRLYFQGGEPSAAERDDILHHGKAVVLVTCNIHSTEIGASQMAVELVHRLATDRSPLVTRILDQVIFLLVPSLNPDGQMMVVDWFNRNLGTPFESSAMPWLYHPYVGHDNNRDMYMFTQQESRLTARLLWHDWFPSVWLDEHQMGNAGARIFVMPATDPINPNVHPLIYRWNGLFGQAQAAALEAAGKDGIIHNATYTNYWQGAMAWSGWWHNQVGLLTELASVRVAAPVEQLRARPGQPPAAAAGAAATERRPTGAPGDPIPPPRDVNARTEYPRPWLGGRWTLRDIVDYELIATMALLEAAAGHRETLLRQIYEVNRATVAAGRAGNPAAIVIPVASQHDPMSAVRLAERLRIGGLELRVAGAAFEADGRAFPAGSFVVPMDQVFARWGRDLLEKQTYPEVRRTPTAPPEPPYDVTAWSLGMQMGVETAFIGEPLPATAALAPIDDVPRPAGSVQGAGPRFRFPYTGADSATVVNRLLKDSAQVWFESATDRGRTTTHVVVANAPRKRLETLAAEFGLTVTTAPAASVRAAARVTAPRVGLYQPWTASMDEGWTRWVLEQYEFAPTVLHNADIKAGALRQRFDAIIFADQQPRAILDGQSGEGVRPEYRGGIGEDGVAALAAFVNDGGTLVMLGASCDLALERWPVPLRNVKRGLTRDEHFAPGTVVRVQVDTASPIGAGLPAETWAFYNNSPFFALTEGFASQSTTVVARYPNSGLVASGWLKGEDLMAGRAAVVQVTLPAGRLVLFGLRPQHRAQTHATFPMLFNALFTSARP